MRNISILLFKTLIFISIFNIAHSMSCLDFNKKLNELEEDFSQIFIMNYTNEKVIYARKDNKFYAYFVQIALFVKFEECIEKNGLSHIIISNISSNNKYEFNLNAKFEHPSESFETIVSDSSSTSGHLSLLYDKFIDMFVNIGVNRKQLLAYISHIDSNYGFLYIYMSDADIMNFVLLEENTRNNEFILYKYGDLHTDKGTEFNEQSNAEHSVVKVDEGEVVSVPRFKSELDGGTLRKHGKVKKGKKRSKPESDEEETIGDLKDSSNLDVATLRHARTVKKGKINRAQSDGFSQSDGGDVGDNHDLHDSTIASSVVNEPMEVDFEHGVINSSKENDKDLKVKKISLSDFDNISLILDNLSDNELIKLKLDKDKLSSEKIFNEVIIKKNKGAKKYYKITLFLENEGQETRENQIVNFNKHNDKIQLEFRSSKRAAKNNPLYKITEESQDFRHRFIINDFDLYVLTTNTEEESKEIKDYYTQVIGELNKKYDQNFVSIQKNITADNSDLVRTKIKELSGNQTIVFIFHGSNETNIEYKGIKIVKKEGPYYDVSIIMKDGTEMPPLVNKCISVIGFTYSISLKIYRNKKDEDKSNTYSIWHADLYGSDMAK